MKKLTSNFAFMALLFTLFCSVANAQIVHNGTIFRIGGDPVGSPAGGSVDATVDLHSFTVLDGGTFSFDILAAEFDDNTFLPVELFMDGRATFIDTEIIIFVDDGMLDIGDFVAENDDDDGGLGFGDGSISQIDSFLIVSLNPGNYLIAIGQLPLDISEVIAGEQLGKFYPLEIDNNGDFVVAESAPYRLTITTVPEPGTVALLIGMASVGGLVLLRRRK